MAPTAAAIQEEVSFGSTFSLGGQISPTLSEQDIEVVETGVATTLGVNASAVNVTGYSATLMTPHRRLVNGDTYSIEVSTLITVYTTRLDARQGDGATLYADLVSKLQESVNSGVFVQTLAIAAIAVAHKRNTTIVNRFTNATVAVTVSAPSIIKIYAPTAQLTLSPVIGTIPTISTLFTADADDSTKSLHIGMVIGTVLGTFAVLILLCLIGHRCVSTAHKHDKTVHIIESDIKFSTFDTFPPQDDDQDYYRSPEFGLIRNKPGFAAAAAEAAKFNYRSHNYLLDEGKHQDPAEHGNNSRHNSQVNKGNSAQQHQPLAVIREQ